MQFIDLKAQQARIRGAVESRILRVLDHGKYILGPEVAELEAVLADYVGVKHCIGVSSGTDALLMAMMALGIKAGDEVITSPFTFIATGEMIALLGAKPIFADIDPKTFNLDPASIEAAMTDKTKAIMPVNLYGQCANFDVINNLASAKGIPVIEDAAQSFGATYNGRRSCGLSVIGCTSFFPSKPLGGYGDSGACFTNEDDLAKAMREIRVHGQDRRYHHSVIGINGRLDTLQAAILLEKFTLFPEEVELRRAVGQYYTDLIQDHAANKEALVCAPFIESFNTSVYAQYTIQVDDRVSIQNKLKAANIPSAVHYPVPLHRQPALQCDVNVAVADALSEKVISLPMHPYLETADQAKVVEVLFA